VHDKVLGAVASEFKFATAAADLMVQPALSRGDLVINSARTLHVTNKQIIVVPEYQWLCYHPHPGPDGCYYWWCDKPLTEPPTSRRREQLRSPDHAQPSIPRKCNLLERCAPINVESFTLSGGTMQLKLAVDAPDPHPQGPWEVASEKRCLQKLK
jgi:hypothetical protein